MILVFFLRKLSLGNNASLAEHGCVAVQGLLHLTALRELGLHSCGLDADALFLIGQNDFPAFQGLNPFFQSVWRWRESQG